MVKNLMIDKTAVPYKGLRFLDSPKGEGRHRTRAAYHPPKIRRIRNKQDKEAKPFGADVYLSYSTIQTAKADTVLRRVIRRRTLTFFAK